MNEQQTALINMLSQIGSDYKRYFELIKFHEEFMIFTKAHGDSIYTGNLIREDLSHDIDYLEKFAWDIEIERIWNEPE